MSIHSVNNNTDQNLRIELEKKSDEIYIDNILTKYLQSDNIRIHTQGNKMTQTKQTFQRNFDPINLHIRRWMARYA